MTSIVGGEAPSGLADGPLAPVEILVVEDNENDTELVQLALKKFHKPVSLMVFPDGVEALDFLERQFLPGKSSSPDLPKVILLDLKLPKLSGMEVLEKIKSDDRLKIIPVVILTSSNELCDIANCYRLGANGYVVKPVEFHEYSSQLLKTFTFWLEVNCPPSQ